METDRRCAPRWTSIPATLEQRYLLGVAQTLDGDAVGAIIQFGKNGGHAVFEEAAGGVDAPYRAAFRFGGGKRVEFYAAFVFSVDGVDDVREGGFIVRVIRIENTTCANATK